MSSKLRPFLHTLLVLALAVVATPRARAADEAPVRSATSLGAVGVHESVRSIMQRQAVLTAEGIVLTDKEKEVEQPDRHHLPQNPAAKAVATFPELPAGMKAVGDDVGAFSPQTVGLSWTGATLSGVNPTLSFPPDCMGAVGPTQYVVFVNGRLVTFNKNTGVADGVINADPDVFFASVINGSSTSDPRIRYDRLTGRWFLAIINVSTPNRILLAVSDAASANAITAGTVWTFFFIDIAATPPAISNTCLADYPTLGVDANALYIGTNNFCGSPSQTYNSSDGYVIRKSSIMGAGPIVVTAFRGLVASSAGAGPYTPQGVDNYDPAATEGYFIGVDNATFSTLMIRRVSTPAGTPTISSNFSVAVPTTGFPINVPHLGNTGGTAGNLSALDDRLFAAHVRNGHIWTAHNIGVNNTGVASGTITRDGSRWYEINMPVGVGSPSLVQSGTVFTPNASNVTTDRHYWIPSVMVSGQGHAALGFSTAGTNERANAATVGRFSSDAAGTMQTPALITASSTAYNPPSDPGGAGTGRRWGDYSYVSLDPLDDMTMWTVHMFCSSTNQYGVRVTKLIAPPPATPSALADVTAGQATVNVTLTGAVVSGSGFYDPGANLPGVPAFNHLQVAVTNGTATGTPPTVVSATYVNPTTVNLVLNASAATPSIGAERYTVTVTNPDGQTAAAAILRVVAGGPVASLAGNVAVTEGNAGTTAATFTVNLAPTSASPVTVRYATSDGTATTADGDYVAKVDSVTVPANTASATFSVNVNGDVKFEGNETFTVTLTGATGATVGVPASGTGTIQNDDSQPVASIVAPAPTAEGNSGTTAFVFPVTLSNPSGSAVSVNWATSDGTATTADADYAAGSGTLTIPANQLSGNITVNVNGDTKYEANETFSVTLSSPSGATIGGTGAATSSITNDDTAPSVSINDVTALEGNAGTTAFGFTVSLSAASGLPVSLNWATADSTATVAHNDYVAGSGTLTFNPGQTSLPVSVTVNGDATAESDETFVVKLSSVNGASVAVAQGVGTIQNDDATPIASISDVSIAEGNSGTTALNFTVTLSNPTDQAVSVDYATSDVSATAGTDYAAATGTLTIPAKVASGQITVLVNGDPCGEADETFTLTLSTPVNVTIGTPSATGTIQNDDDVIAPTVTVTAPNGGETWVTGSSVNITWTAGDDVAVSGVDLLLSRDGGANYSEVLATGLANSGTYAWTVGGPATTTAFVKAVAHDAGCNSAADTSDAAFTISVPSTGVTSTGAVTEFALGSIRPNPTPSAAQIEYMLPREASVRLSVVDVQGREVALLASGLLNPGRYTATWSGNTARGPAARGVYFVRYQAGGKTFTKRLVLAH